MMIDAGCGPDVALTPPSRSRYASRKQAIRSPGRSRNYGCTATAKPRPVAVCKKPATALARIGRLNR